MRPTVDAGGEWNCENDLTRKYGAAALRELEERKNPFRLFEMSETASGTDATRARLVSCGRW